MSRLTSIKTAQFIGAMATVIALLLAMGPVADAQPDPNSPRFKAVVVLETFLGGNEDIAHFIEQHCASNMTDGDSRAETLATLQALRQAAHGGELEDISPVGPLAVQMNWGVPDGAGVEITFELTDSKPHKFRSIQVDEVTPFESNNPITLTWESLERWMNVEAENGFTGAILMMRDGKTMLHEGYGWANAEKKILNTPNTIFAIGSTPIDFTMASILQLQEQGKLDLSDHLTKYFGNVPEDKRAITLDHLMSGRSGLQNFHGIAADGNPDHTWIDRDEAMRRIFAPELRFAPGQGRAHSHSAFGVLAAIVEIVSGQSYQDYTREYLYEPAGMTDTGFFGEPIPEERLAVGIGMSSSGKINAPPYWGPTSWLVMGSGGQVSTVGDMGRWLNALHAGKIINQQNLRRIVGTGGSAFGVGGDMFGFEIHYSMAPDNFMIFIANTVDSRTRRRAIENMSEQLRELYPQRGNPYSVGIGIDGDEHGLLLSMIVPGSAADRDGLQAGDRLLTIAGKSMQEHDPIELLTDLLQTDAPIVFDIERNGQHKSISVTPKAK